MLDTISVINYLAIMGNLKKLKKLKIKLNKDTHAIEIEYIDMVIQCMEINKSRYYRLLIFIYLIAPRCNKATSVA